MNLYLAAFWEVVREHGWFILFILLGSAGLLVTYRLYRQKERQMVLPTGIPPAGVAKTILEQVSPGYVGGVVGYDLGSRLVSSMSGRPTLLKLISFVLVAVVIGIPVLLLILY